METKGFRLTNLSISAETNWLFKNHGCERRTNKLGLFFVPAKNIESNYRRVNAKHVFLTFLNSKCITDGKQLINPLPTGQAY
jgi:hypothetical protein